MLTWLRPDVLPRSPDIMNRAKLAVDLTESGFHSRFLRRIQWEWQMRWKKAGQLLLHSPFHPLYLRLPGRGSEPAASIDYRQWVAREDSFQPRDWAAETARWRVRPTISILTPTHHPRREWLECAIESVKKQCYPHWELCVYDDGSQEPWLRDYLQSQAAADPRIRVAFGSLRAGISAALNHAGTMATSEWVAFLDHDDVLHPCALQYVAEACQEEDVDVLYSDEDHLDPSGARVAPSFKPDWSPDLLDSCMYIGHLFVARRKRIDDAGWFRSEYDGAQDYDLALRVTGKARKIHHIPRVLYHWRRHSDSAAMNLAAKPYAHEAGRRALTNALARRNVQGTVADGLLPRTYCIHRAASSPRVSLIVRSHDARRSARLAEARRRTAYRDVEWIVGREASAATSEFLVFLDDSLTPVNPAWLQVMVEHLQRPEVGVVGGRLLDPSGALWDAGAAFGLLDGVGHPGRGSFEAGLMYYLSLPRNVSAVTAACLGIRRSVFHDLGGFDPAFARHYYDLDLCLKAREHGLRVIVDPRVELTTRAYESRTGGASASSDWQLLQQRWSAVLAQPDPYYPRVFDRRTEEIRLFLD